MKKVSFILTVTLFFISISLTMAQEATCGTDIIFNQALQKDNDLMRKNAELEHLMALRSQYRVQNNTVYKIPVVVHVIHEGEEIGTGSNISDAQVQSAIQHLTTSFRGNGGQGLDIHIEFHLAKQDINCNATSGIVRVDGRSVTDYATNGITFIGNTTNEEQVKALSRWANDKYYNIWVVSKIEGSDTGYSGFAPVPTDFIPTTYGSVVRYNAFGYDPDGSQQFNLRSNSNENKTIVHEAGHTLRLWHTFEGDKGLHRDQALQCPTEENGCVTFNRDTWKFEYRGDCCSDTPRHKRGGIAVVGNPCAEKVNDRCDPAVSLEPSIHNYMSYSYQSCKTLFTPEQRIRMRQAIELLLPTLLTSKAISEPPVALLMTSEPNCAPATQAEGLRASYTGIKSVKFGVETNKSGYPIQDSATGYLDGTEECLRSFEVAGAGSAALEIQFLTTRANYVKAWIDFNNDGNFTPSELVMDLSNKSSNSPAIKNINIPSNLYRNQLYRMRIICDLNPISDACTSPVYGQVEDYAALFSGLSLVPVQLISFSGKINQQQIDLNWQTALEVDNKYFTIEHSIDGVHFNKVKNIKPNKIGLYKWIDKQPKQGVNYYRLLQTSLNGEEKIISNVISFNYSDVNKKGLNIYPNPIVDSEVLTMQLFSSKEENITIQLYDVNGKTQLSKQQKLTKGNNTFQISISDLPAGLYLLQASYNEQIFTKKIVKQ